MVPSARRPAIAFDDKGITAVWREQEPEMPFIPWADVERVMAYKVDCYTLDEIRLEFLSSRSDSLVVTEEMVGWQSLVKELPKHLPGFPEFERWFSKVAAPPFAENLSVLYERAQPDALTT